MLLDLNRQEAGRLPVEATQVQMADLLGEIKMETQGLCDQSGLEAVVKFLTRAVSARDGSC
jgi:hypothetical protein